MENLGAPYEVIVVDDASTDETHRIAQEMGARTLQVALRRIAAVRNAGARVAIGEVLFFVDADTKANEQAVSAALNALHAGAVGGGCVPDLEGQIPLWARVIHSFACMVGRVIRLVGGCFLFCTRTAFDATGGFPERFYAGEDIAFVQALKKVGRFVVVKPTVITSARKLDVVSPWQVIQLLLTIALRGPRYESKWVLDILYGRRAEESRKSAKTDRTGSPSSNSKP